MVSRFNLSQSFNYTPYLCYKKRFQSVYGPSALAAQKCLSGEKLSCPDCGKRFDPDQVSSNTVVSTWRAWSSALCAQKCLSGEKLTCPDCDKLFHRKVCQVRSLAVPILAKRSDPDWVSSNTVPNTFSRHCPVLCLHRKFVRLRFKA